MTADLPALIARLEAAEVGGQELNGLIFRALADDPHGKDHWFMSCGAMVTEDNAPSVTTSLDSTIALAERVHGEARALDLLQDVLSLHGASGIAIRDLPRLLCSFILRAKQGEGE